MNEQRFPAGWDEQRMKRLLAELDAQTEVEWVAADAEGATKPSLRYRRLSFLKFDAYSLHTRLPSAVALGTPRKIHPRTCAATVRPARPVPPERSNA